MTSDKGGSALDCNPRGATSSKQWICNIATAADPKEHRLSPPVTTFITAKTVIMMYLPDLGASGN